MSHTLTLHLRSYALGQDAGGRAEWQEQQEIRRVPAQRTALLICDMWDQHWSRGAAERVDAMARQMNPVLAAARSLGAQIIHAPSETVDFYARHPARLRMLEVPPSPPPAESAQAGKCSPDPPLPFDASDGGSDTGETESYAAWTRQHPALEIDPERDVISDRGGGNLQLSAPVPDRAGADFGRTHKYVHPQSLLCHQTDGALGPADCAGAGYDRRDVQSGQPPVHQPRAGHRAGNRLHRAVLVPDSFQPGYSVRGPGRERIGQR